MDPFTFAVSIAGLSSLALQLVQILAKYKQAVGSQGQLEIEDVESNLNALSTALQQFEATLRSGVLQDATFSSNSSIAIAVKHCQDRLRYLYEMLAGNGRMAPMATTAEGDVELATLSTRPAPPPHGILSLKAKELKARLIWPFRRSEVNTICASLLQCIQIFTFCLVVENCRTMLKTRDMVLEELQSQGARLESVSAAMASVPQEITNLRQQLEDVRDVLSQSMRLAAEHATAFERAEETLQESKVRAILEWLSSSDWHQRHEALCATRNLHSTTRCKAHIELAQVQDWLAIDGPGSVILAHGDPGAGKSVFCSEVIDELSHRTRGSRPYQVAMCYLYFEHSRQEEQTLAHSLRVLFRQLLAQCPASSIPEGIIDAHKSGKLPGTSLMLNFMAEVCKCVGKTYFCIDALDECGVMEDFLEAMRELCLEGVSWLVTGRMNVEHRVRQLVPEVTVLGIRADDNEVREYIVSKLDRDAVKDPDLMTDTLRADIIDTLASSCSGIFLLPYLHIANILSERTVKQRRLALQRLPPDLNGAYEQTMTRIRAQSAASENLALEILAWVLLARRPLKAVELRHALAIEVDAADYDFENLPPQSFISTCLGLVVVDVATTTISLVHETLDKYLRSHGRRHVQSFNHSFLARKCLAYAMFPGVRRWDLPWDHAFIPLDCHRESYEDEHSALCQEGFTYAGYASPTAMRVLRKVTGGTDYTPGYLYTRSHQTTLNDKLSRYCFMRYAVMFWASHYKFARPGTDDVLYALVQQYLTLPDEDMMNSAAVFYSETHTEGLNMTPVAWRNPRLHMLAYFGLPEVWVDLIARGVVREVEYGPDSTGRPPLVYAVLKESQRMTSFLLASYPDQMDAWAETAMVAAWRKGSEKMLHILSNSLPVNRLVKIDRLPPATFWQAFDKPDRRTEAFKNWLLNSTRTREPVSEDY